MTSRLQRALVVCRSTGSLFQMLRTQIHIFTSKPGICHYKFLDWLNHCALCPSELASVTRETAPAHNPKKHCRDSPAKDKELGTWWSLSLLFFSLRFYDFDNRWLVLIHLVYRFLTVVTGTWATNVWSLFGDCSSSLCFLDNHTWILCSTFLFLWPRYSADPASLHIDAHTWHSHLL